MNCLWCGTDYEPRLTGGKPQKFCSHDCRHAFHKAARQWAESEVFAGRLSVAEIREMRPQSTYTLLVRRLERAGCHRVHAGTGFEVWHSPVTGNFPVPDSVRSRHTANTVLRQAGIDVA